MIIKRELGIYFNTQKFFFIANIYNKFSNVAETALLVVTNRWHFSALTFI